VQKIRNLLPEDVGSQLPNSWPALTIPTPRDPESGDTDADYHKDLRDQCIRLNSFVFEIRSYEKINKGLVWEIE
jgi:hypothetical protein